MKTKKRPALKLSAETLRRLDDDALANARPAGATGDDPPSGDTALCGPSRLESCEDCLSAA